MGKLRVLFPDCVPAIERLNLLAGVGQTAALPAGEDGKPRRQIQGTPTPLAEIADKPFPGSTVKAVSFGQLDVFFDRLAVNDDV